MNVFQAYLRLIIRIRQVMVFMGEVNKLISPIEGRTNEAGMDVV